VDAIKEALFKFDQNKDTKAACMVSLNYLSGQVCFVMTALLLIQIDVVYSFWPLSFTFTMRLLLREYSTNSWRSHRLEGMCRQVCSQTLFKLLVVRPAFKVIGWWYMPLWWNMG